MDTTNKVVAFSHPAAPRVNGNGHRQSPELTEKIEYTSVGANITAPLSYEEWAHALATWQRIEASVQWVLGDLIAYGERKYGEMYAQALDETEQKYSTLRDYVWVSGRYELSERSDNLTWYHHRIAAPEDNRLEWLEKAEQNDWSANELRQQIRRSAQVAVAQNTPLPAGKYRCIVIDPPWHMEKIERDLYPNQGRDLDYPTMTLEDIAALPIGNLAVEEGCHLYLWTTQKYLPDALELVRGWGFNYQCLLTWVKPSGFTPYSWMYNTEHIIFARKGNLQLMRLGVKLSFEAPQRGHSVKPLEFYRMVREVSPEPRLDMFARTQHEGFSPWGNESPNAEKRDPQLAMG